MINKKNLNLNMEQKKNNRSHFSENENKEQKKNNRNYFLDNDSKEFITEVIFLSRHACTKEGGRKFSFKACVAVGDQKGCIGIGFGKAAETNIAINKAEKKAKKKIFKIPILNNTIVHDCFGKSCTTRLMLKKAKEGTGCKVNDKIKILSRLAGIVNLTGKIHGSTNYTNIVYAFQNAVKNIETQKRIYLRRGIKLIKKDIKKKLKDKEENE